MIICSAALLGLLVAVLAAVPSDAPVQPAGAASQVVPLGEMVSARAAHQATPLRTGEVIVTGGCRGRSCEDVIAAAEVYDPATRSFRPIAGMTVRRASHAAAALADGRLLVSGGWTGASATASAEVYDPATGRWAPVGEMTEARASHAAVRLADGRLLIAGGGDGRSGTLSSAEVFDPVTATFSPVGSMRTNHYLATPLADGRVLMTGGHGPLGESLESARSSIRRR